MSFENRASFNLLLLSIFQSLASLTEQILMSSRTGFLTCKWLTITMLINKEK